MITELQKTKKGEAKRSTTQETESVCKKRPDNQWREPKCHMKLVAKKLAKYRSDLGRNGKWDPCLVSTLAPSC